MARHLAVQSWPVGILLSQGSPTDRVLGSLVKVRMPAAINEYPSPD
jgi:hypothetical protein